MNYRLLYDISYNIEWFLLCYIECIENNVVGCQHFVKLILACAYNWQSI